jgi:hypothetical protein
MRQPRPSPAPATVGDAELVAPARHRVAGTADAGQGYLEWYGREGRQEKGPAAGRQATSVRGAPQTAARAGQDQQRQPAMNRAASGSSRGTILLQVARNIWLLMVLLLRCRLPRRCRAAQLQGASFCLPALVGAPAHPIAGICRALSVGAGRQVRLERLWRVVGQQPAAAPVHRLHVPPGPVRRLLGAERAHEAVLGGCPGVGPRVGPERRSASTADQQAGQGVPRGSPRRPCHKARSMARQRSPGASGMGPLRPVGQRPVRRRWASAQRRIWAMVNFGRLLPMPVFYGAGGLAPGPGRPAPPR